MRKKSSCVRSVAEKRIITKYLLLVSGIVGVFLVVASAYVFAFARPADTSVSGYDYTDNTSADKEEGEKSKSFTEKYLIPPKLTTVLVMGTDKTDLLSDVIILGFFDRDTGEIDLVNIPRDTYTTLSDSLRQKLEEADRWAPTSMKINELHSYAGEKLGDEAVKIYLEETFHISIDYTASVSLDSFRAIVDIVGPIEMEIPASGLYYYDPDQNYRISIPGGIQQLDGEMAEGLVRYRDTYARGDLQRIEVQQEFLKELFKQTLKKDTLINNAPALVSTIIEYVDTDFKMEDAPKYLPYISKLGTDKFETRMLPGAPDYINNGEKNISYYVYDSTLCTELFNSILYPVDKDNLGISKIQAFNGGTNNHIYNEIIQSLEADGYEITEGGDYEGTKKSTSRIVLKDEETENDLERYFKLVTIETDEEIEDAFDCIIITGIGE